MSENGDERATDVAAGEIVVAVGSSPAAAAALRRAAQQSRVTGVPLRIVHAWQMTAAPAGATSTSFWTSFWVASAADARARATRWVMDTLGGSAATVRWVLEIVEEPSDDALLELSSQPGGSA